MQVEIKITLDYEQVGRMRRKQVTEFFDKLRTAVQESGKVFTVDGEEPTIIESNTRRIG